MKLILPLVLLLTLGACAIAPTEDGNSSGNGNGAKAGGDTVVVCHKGKKTLELPRDAAEAHLNHGDRRGPC